MRCFVGVDEGFGGTLGVLGLMWASNVGSISVLVARSALKIKKFGPVP